MNARINQLVKSLLQKDSLDQCSLHEVKQFAERHPYFGAAQLLLTKKLQIENSDQFDDQLQRTYLFFHNPLWVEHLLNDTGTAVIKKAPQKEEPLIVEKEVESTPEELVTPPTAVEPVETVFTAADIADNPEPVIEVEAVSETTPAPEEKSFEIPGLKMETIDPATTELTFEPFHTVDYFASQGIKIKDDERPKDKFGIQLKSFTDWLKTMKRLPVTEIAKNVATPADHKVEQLAEHSLAEKEVITEAMAEVWEKQGNSVKAIDIYTKLSLLEPAKSTYFAAKIEELKKLN